MIERLLADPEFCLERADIEKVLVPENFTGRAPEQVEEFLNEVIRPMLAANADCIGQKAELNV